MEKIFIGEVKVILDDLGGGKGSIIVSNGYNAYEYFWGAMGGSLKDFLLGINGDYFATKLIGHRDEHEFDIKGSVKNVRAHLREVLPWYNYMSAQKELRSELKMLEYCCTDQDFVREMGELPNKLMCLELDRWDESDFLDIIREELGCEPWHFIDNKPSKEYVFLNKFLPKLQKHIKKELKELVH
jgi:hypothetical protein